MLNKINFQVLIDPIIKSLRMTSTTINILFGSLNKYTL